MKKEELFETLSDIDEKKIKQAREYNGKSDAKIYKWATAIVAAAAVALTAIFSPLFRNLGIEGGGSADYPGVKTVLASYPAPTSPTLSAEEFTTSDDSWKWWQEYIERVEKTEGLSREMLEYYTNLSGQILVNGDENTVLSPLNTYIAFAMLAETTEGDSRQQILDMLGAKDIESLRKNIKQIWESNYINTPVMQSLLANSLWLDDSYKFNEKTLKLLADNYYASSFRGTPGNEAFNKALQKWADDNTGNLLTEYTKDLKTNVDTVMAIMSTIYYKANWVDKFSNLATAPETFHGVKGDTTVEMMHNSIMTRYAETDKFIATYIDVINNGQMFFYLPKEGVSVNELASDPDVLALAQNMDDSRWNRYVQVNMSIPKFKVSAQTDLIPVLQSLGVTDVFDYTVADFSPVTVGENELCLSSAEHAALVEIDEEGVTGAAYTALMMTEGAMLSNNTLDFVLDEPFMFAVTGADGSILFDGLVKNID